MSPLTTRQKKYLRALAHDLKPVVYVGRQGLSEAVVNAADRALGDHELIKVRFIDYKDEKRDLAQKIAAETGAVLLGIKGHLACFYRCSPIESKQNIQLPAAGDTT